MPSLRGVLARLPWPFLTFTGSGEARPDDRAAAGGGTFLHRHSDGSEVAHGAIFDAQCRHSPWICPRESTLQPVSAGLGHTEHLKVGLTNASNTREIKF